MKIVLRNGPEKGRELTVPDGTTSWRTPVKRALSLASYSTGTPSSCVESMAHIYRKTNDVALYADQTWHWVFDYTGEL